MTGCHPDVWDDFAELDSLAQTNKALKGKSFILRCWWRQGYASLVRRGLVKWSDPPKGFDKRRFAGIQITAKGRKALSRQES